MANYLYLLAASGILTLIPVKRLDKKHTVSLLIILSVVIILFIGLRGESIGPDWYTYQVLYAEQIHFSFIQAFTQLDPGYYGLSWVFRNMFEDIVYFNFFISSVTVIIYYKFCKRQSYPLIAYFVGLPFFIIYTINFPRQAIAMAIAAFSFKYLFSEQKVRYILGIFIAILFHKTAIFFLIFLIDGLKKIKTASLVGFLLLFSLLFYIFLSSRLIGFISDFSEIYTSNAAHLKGIIYLLPAFAYILFRKRILAVSKTNERNFLDMFCFIVVISYLLIFLNSLFYNAIDRLLIYFLPFEILILSNYLPRVINQGQIHYYAFILVIYKLIFFSVWLNNAVSAKHFVPYYFNL